MKRQLVNKKMYTKLAAMCLSTGLCYQLFTWYHKNKNMIYLILNFVLHQHKHVNIVI